MLKALSLLPVYESSEHNLVDELIVPLLANCQEYYRGVGYFSSGWLRVASKGIVQLVENGGRARVIMSPILDERDWRAIQLGEQARNDETLRRVLEEQVQDLAVSLDSDTLNCLAWLISDDLFEIRFAIPRDLSGDADYHDKVAYFRDPEGNTVAIHGSFNDSVKGTLNGEAFSVFRSWEPGHVAFVQQHVERLSRLWDGQNSQFSSILLPQAVKDKLVQLRTSSRRPYQLPASKPEVKVIPQEPHVPYDLHDYQRQAIGKWIEAGCCGILEMATGTGKTFTSLAAAANRYAVGKRLACIILVPYLHLLEQWREHCVQFGFYPILCSGSHKGWHSAARSAITDYKMGLSHICLIAVHDTAASGEFAGICSKLPSESTLLIADEAHALGAPSMRKALLPVASMRLGLTATPQRWYDEEGTAVLMEYFRGVCFEFTLEQAIGRFLVPYTYHPVLVSLTPDEEETVGLLTKRIGMCLKGIKDGLADEEDLKRLLLERSRIVASAESKNETMRSSLIRFVGECQAQGRTPRDILVYCAAGNHRAVLRDVADVGLTCHEFVHYVTLDQRWEILRDFADGRIQALVAIKCLDEGVDVPTTQTAFFMASTTNPREFIQRRGRVLRKAEGKESARIFDFIVVPCLESSVDVAAFLLRREMPRFAEFSASAANKYDARQMLRPILDRYEMLHMLDMTPWEVYREAKATHSTLEGD